MAYTTYLWGFGGWFIVVLITLPGGITINQEKPAIVRFLNHLGYQGFDS